MNDRHLRSGNLLNIGADFPGGPLFRGLRRLRDENFSLRGSVPDRDHRSGEGGQHGSAQQYNTGQFQHEFLALSFILL
ncbi:hypothetical protein SDC9_145747 [bioreactor metagenome]|uniref:Uncharacterized protein n=1 Tax=bioreactor metagenome TaxID=1076179 RepID=A0A645EB68_9ZZZZ